MSRLTALVPNTALVAATITLATALSAGPSPAQQVLPNLCGVDGAVNAVARSGNTLYLGGYFSVAGTPTGGGVPLDDRGGDLAGRFPRVCGTVNAVIPDGEGGWFIGGYFAFVEGEPRANLAHILRDGRLASWAPTVWGESRYNGYDPVHPAVHALALRGRRLFVGGAFSSVNGEARNNLCVLDADSGSLLSWNPNSNGAVRCLATHQGHLYVGGAFTAIAGSARVGLAAFDGRTGALESWNLGTNGVVLAMAISGRTLYAAGQFDRIGGQIRNSVAAVDLESGVVTSWDASLKPARQYSGSWTWPFVEGLDVQGGTVYLGGWFHGAGGQPRESVAALDAVTGKATEFDGHLGGASGGGLNLVNCLTVRGSTVFIGGRFSNAGGAERANLAALDARSGLATRWNPRAAGPLSKNESPWDPRREGPVVALAASGDAIYAGGAFTHMNDWQVRGGAAAIDLTTGKVTPWNPNIEGLFVQKLAVIGNSVYLAGAFRKVNGETRENCAAVDGTTGAPLSWNPGNVYSLAAHGDRLYVGGLKNPFTGLYADYLCPMDPVTGVTSAWIDYPSNGIETMLATDSTLYLGGNFWSIDGVTRRAFAAVDPATGAVLPWAPAVAFGNVGGYATYAMAMHDDAVYLSGKFIQMGGEPRDHLAAVDAHTGNVLPWAPNPDDLVLALATNGNTVWAGGRFGSIGGQLRPLLAALDLTTGAPSDWQAHADGEVRALASTGDTVFVAGAFRRLGGFPQGGIAMILSSLPSVTRAARATSVAALEPGTAPMRLWSAPNPIRDVGTVRYTLPEAAIVDLAIFDVEGRRTHTLVEGALEKAGTHDLHLRTEGWAPGIYLCRLSVAGRSVTHKLLVVR